MFPVKYLTREDLKDVASRLGVSVSVIRAVSAVEASRGGFIRGTDLPSILFEGHLFHRLTGGIFDEEHPTISHKAWTKAHYVGGRGEYDRLLKAIRINNGDPEPALKSTSWGMFQILGANFAAAGYASVREFVNDMASGEDRQLQAFVSFIQSEGLDDELRDQKWEDFARGYNGPVYAKNDYHIKMAEAYTMDLARAQAERAGGEASLERGDAMKLQTALNLALRADLVVDGWIGPSTRSAVRQLKKRMNLANPDAIDLALLDELGLDLPNLAISETEEA